MGASVTNILPNSTRAHNFNNIINDTTIFFSSHGVFTTDVVISGRYSHFLQHIIKVIKWSAMLKQVVVQQDGADARPAVVGVVVVVAGEARRTPTSQGRPR